MFTSPVSIGNRACQHCGEPQIDVTLGFAEQSQRAFEISSCYGKLKRAELQSSVWTFAVRRAVIRPIDTTTLLLVPTLWESTATYFKGSVVVDQTGFLWQSRIPNNIGNQPEDSPAQWEPYFGPLTVSLYDPTQSYFTGEVVYTAPGDGTYNVYLSLITGNVLDPSLPNLWSALTTYFQNQVVTVYPAWSSGTTYSEGQTVAYTDGNTYTSLTNGNLNNIPPSSSTQWALVPTLTLASAAVTLNNSQSSTITTSPVIEWSPSSAYSTGNVVLFKGAQYVSLVSNNTGNYPNASGSPSWAALTGGVAYMSLIDLNTGNNPASAPAVWSGATTYALNALVGGSDGVIYKSLANGNLDNNPVADGGVHWQSTGVLNPWTTVFTQGAGNQQWLQIGGSASPGGAGLAQVDIQWPANSGPLSQWGTKNVLRLPAGFLRPAPQNPKSGVYAALGGPSGEAYRDWVYDGAYLVTSESQPIILRFVADVADVTSFHDMFCEGLAARIGFEVCPTLTQSTAKQQAIEQQYKKFMDRAVTVNAIEQGFEDPPDDDFITVRL